MTLSMINLNNLIRKKNLFSVKSPAGFFYIYGNEEILSDFLDVLNPSLSKKVHRLDQAKNRGFVVVTQ